MKKKISYMLCPPFFLFYAHFADPVANRAARRADHRHIAAWGEYYTLFTENVFNSNIGICRIISHLRVTQPEKL